MLLKDDPPTDEGTYAGEVSVIPKDERPTTEIISQVRHGDYGIEQKAKKMR